MSSKEHFAQRLMDWFGHADQYAVPDDGTGVNPESSGNAKTLVMRTSSPPKKQPSSDIDSRYESIRTLGKGAYGTVTLAKDRRIGRLIAIKRLNADVRSNISIYKHFLQEARIAGQIENSHIVTIYDVLDGEFPSILMEYLGGGNLEAVIRDHAPLDEISALTLLGDVMNGLKDAHALGVVHRDVKPSNILFDQNGTAKISDFGVAFMPDNLGGIDDETSRTSFVVGTPDYMSPEQLQPHMNKVDCRADLYACGLILYEMLTGKRHQAFGNHVAHKELLEKIQLLSLPDEKDFPAGVSKGARQLVRSLIRLKPEKRPASAEVVMGKITTLIKRSFGKDDLKFAGREEHSVRMEMFADILRLFLLDGVISAAERRELIVRSRRLGILQGESIKLEETVRRELKLPAVRDLQRYAGKAEALLVDRDLSEDDRRVLDELGRSLKISVAERRKIEENIMIKFQMKEGHVEDLIP